MLKFNWNHLHKEIQKIELISDDVEKATRFELVDIIMDKVNEYNEHIIQYEYTKKREEIINRGVFFIPQPIPRTIKAI